MHLEEINQLCTLLESLRSTPPFSDEPNITRYVESLLAELRLRKVVTRIGNTKIEELIKVIRDEKKAG